MVGYIRIAQLGNFSWTKAFQSVDSTKWWWLLVICTFYLLNLVFNSVQLDQVLVPKLHIISYMEMSFLMASIYALLGFPPILWVSSTWVLILYWIKSPEMVNECLLLTLNSPSLFSDEIILQLIWKYFFFDK